MLNTGSSRSPEKQIQSLIEGLLFFLKNNTGETNDPTVDHFAINNEGVLSNNRHFISWSAQEGTPNGDATTEGQSLLISGLIQAYIGSGRTKKHLLEAAEYYWDAYVKAFYAGVEPPSIPSRWVSNWIVNGKQPTLADCPVDFTLATHSGFKNVVLNYTNGQTQVPYGAPYYGEYLDRATYAFVGHMAWGAINASVVGLKDDGVTPDWNKDGLEYDVDWIIDSRGRKISYDLGILDENPSEPVGTIQLLDKTINGSYMTNFASLIPVDKGGYMIQRNQVQHNRPLHVPVAPDFMGNSSDSEQWFCEACYLLWKETGNIRYYNGWRASEWTLIEYTKIEEYDAFFRQTTTSLTPFTDGISYDYAYSNDGIDPVITYNRNEQGNIIWDTNKSCQNTLEQQAVWYSVDGNSNLVVNVGGGDNEGNPIQWKTALKLSDKRGPDEPYVEYGIALPQTNNKNITFQYSIPLNSLTKLEDENGNPYVVADTRAVVTYGTTASYKPVFDRNVVDDRYATYMRIDLVSDDAGCVIGFWLLESKVLDVQRIYYRSGADIKLKIYDKNGIPFYWIVPASATWTTFEFDWSTLRWDNWYSDHDEVWTRPTPVRTPLDQINFDIMDSSTSWFEYYCFDVLPERFPQGQTKVTSIFSITSNGDAPYRALLGNCVVTNYVPGSLYCTPGVIPYSNIYNPQSYVIDGWHGMPYPGYQFPFIFVYTQEPNKDTLINNMVEFLYQSQQWYYNKFGLMGPGASTYIWNRWDNYKYGTADTWTMYQWGDEDAWDGYQARAFYGAANGWHHMLLNNYPVPAKLIAYVENWLKFLIGYMNQYNMTPTNFPMESVPVPLEDDFTGHMSALWLAGACYAYMSGCRVAGLQDYIEKNVNELLNNYVNTGIPNQVMNGSWSPAIRLNTGNDKTSNGMFFGFWGGEIFKGLGIYLQYREFLRNPT